MSREVHVRFCERVEAINWVASALLDFSDLLSLSATKGSYYRMNYSAVVGSIMETTSLIEFAGNPPFIACSRTISSFGAM